MYQKTDIYYTQDEEFYEERENYIDQKNNCNGKDDLVVENYKNLSEQIENMINEEDVEQQPPAAEPVVVLSGFTAGSSCGGLWSPGRQAII